METERIERRLAAILAADVAGYSRMMSRDEEGTLRRLKAHLGELVEPHIAAHRGRIVKRTGDGLLVDFASAVEAVRCAMAIQCGMADRNRTAGQDGRIEFRIGINLGDVIIEGDDIFGDGVNLAARLESIAEPGGIFISRTVRDSVRDTLGIALEDLGERPVKNLPRPVRVFRVGLPDGMRPRPPAVPEKPSIAVLPFANMSGDVEQEYFSDGISEDLITDLSKVSALFVIARNSSFTYKGRSVKVQEIGRELGVRFVLEGSIRKAGNRVRITAQLVDAGTGGHLWAERFDREIDDIFATQDEVVRKIVEALAVKLSRGEAQDLLRSGGTRNLEAYECWLRARQLMGRGTPETIGQARALHSRAIELDPAFPGPHVGMAFAAVSDYVNAWTPDPALALDEGERWARRAIELDKRHPGGHVALGNVLVWRRRHDDALAALDQAVALDANYAQGHALRGMALMYAGHPREALEALAVAMRLDPLFPNILLHLMAQAHFSQGEDETAASRLAERIARNPTTDASRMLLAACYGHLGRVEDARAAWAGLMEVNPNFSVAQRESVLPYRDARDFRRILEGLAKAGLP
ncbi:MAG: adenylate/guanylate cyclase domain-containing protein [Pseudomonadota bacterium]